MSSAPEPVRDIFLPRWQHSEAAERANYALFLTELCDFLNVPRPEPTRAEDALNTYVFEKTVTFRYPDGTTSTGRIDLYKRSHFVLEAKQGSNAPNAQPTLNRLRRGTARRGTIDWDEAMLAARGQAEQYAKALPATEGWPPFLITVDVGHSIELFSDFSLTGKAYQPFPDPRSYRILLHQLAIPEIHSRLRAVWLDPHSLDPSRYTARVTREVAAKLALLALNLERSGHQPKAVAEFLTRCIFTSFAEDVELIPHKSWLKILERLKRNENSGSFPQMAESLWSTMNTGGFSTILEANILQFNGGLFESTTALPPSSEPSSNAPSTPRSATPSVLTTPLAPTSSGSSSPPSSNPSAPTGTTPSPPSQNSSTSTNPRKPSQQLALSTAGSVKSASSIPRAAPETSSTSPSNT